MLKNTIQRAGIKFRGRFQIGLPPGLRYDDDATAYGTVRCVTIRYGTSRRGPRRTKKALTITIIVVIVYSHPHTSQYTVVLPRMQATKLQSHPFRSSCKQQQRAAARPGQVGPGLVLAGEPYKVGLTCKGPSERAEQLGCSLSISIPSRLVSSCCPLLSRSGRIQSCPVAVLRCVVRPRRVDETGRMQLD